MASRHGRIGAVVASFGRTFGMDVLTWVQAGVTAAGATSDRRPDLGQARRTSPP
jgi:hypothetical protein